MVSFVAIYGLFSDEKMYSFARHLLRWEYEPLHEQILVVEETKFCGALSHNDGRIFCMGFIQFGHSRAI